jgi:hypothetical protein
MRYILNNPDVSTIIPGMRKEHVRLNLATSSSPLPEELHTSLRNTAGISSGSLVGLSGLSFFSPTPWIDIDLHRFKPVVPLTCDIPSFP